MKKLLTLFFLFCVSFLSAQDYQNICTPGTTIFNSQDNYFKAFRRDSVAVQGGNDTLFYSYRTIRDSSVYIGVCRDTSNGDALGRRIWKRHDGWFWFFNKYNDTVKINTQAALNESWNFCPIRSWNGHLQATVTEIITDSVLGTTDQVKVITFQAKDEFNNNVASIFNQKKIKLSKHYGLSEVYDIYWTPDDTLHLTLIGKTSPAIGLQPFGWADVYNFDVGDEFHYYDHQVGGMGWTTVESKSIHRILAKTVYGNMDSVHYLVEVCKKTWFPTPPPNTQEFYDTVSESYNFIQMASDFMISRLPDEFFGSSGSEARSFARRYSEFNNRPVQQFNVNGYFYNWADSCYSDPFEVWGPIISYAPGLGQTNYAFEEFDITITGYFSDLIYYKKGAETWGAPVATDCATLVGTGINMEPQHTSILIVPNPSESDVTVMFNGISQVGRLHYTLTNVSGICILTGETISPSFVIRRNGLPAGLYILYIWDNSGVISAKTRILFR